MKFLLCLVLATLCLGSPANAQPAGESSQFQGWVFYEEDQKPTQTIIVRTAEELKAFQKRIPTKVPSKRRPARENKDPLLSGDSVDFQKYSLVLALRGKTLSAHPVHMSTETQQDKVVLKFKLPEPPPEARPYGWGAYRGILIPKTSKTIVVKFD